MGLWGRRQERVEEAEALKTQGNTLFAEAAYDDAAALYSDAIAAAPDEYAAGLAAFHGNRAACHMCLVRLGLTQLYLNPTPLVCARGATVHHCSHCSRDPAGPTTAPTCIQCRPGQTLSAQAPLGHLISDGSGGAERLFVFTSTGERCVAGVVVVRGRMAAGQYSRFTLFAQASPRRALPSAPT